ncbi:MAG: hypothetical protein PHP26_09215 [Syntrophomonas sp.]|uniref:hypothetical protein n=1 Tax=Syntrophomonas sp. TaxID=2053627 RepID=UPI002628F725|nr:hypothetical protein [Syntrophomonas sp.]MDD3880152.1 hypothetical protein [Syntrophomonas sp.]MDD4626410.1 hypothetical protein [Syntrophomonas sp.]
MSRARLLVFTGLFMGLAAFLLGVGFLFLVNVPVEELLARKGTSQTLINIAMIGIIVLWALSTAWVTHYFFKKVVSREKPPTSFIYLILGILFLMAAVVFYFLLTTGSPVIARLQGTVSEPGERYAFGPYPDNLRLRELKAEGYDGVISLLSPMIPFEKILLEQEMEHGKEVGITIHSLPMLPWVSENQESIQQAMELAESGDKRYYIHCYLGKHRADLIKRVLMGQEPENEEIQECIYKTRLERGKLYFYQDSRIIMGPYPTDEEWFHLIQRGQFQEIVADLDPEIPGDLTWIKREENICKEMGLNYTVMPMRKKGNDYQGLLELASYISSSQHKVYVHGFLITEKNLLLDGFLRGGDLEHMGKPFPERLQGGEVFRVSYNLFLGPQPGAGEKDLLKKAGITHIEALDLNENMPPAVAASYIQALPPTRGVCFFYGFPSPDYCSQLASILGKRYYGFKRDNIPALIGGHKVDIITERLLLGRQPEASELRTLAGLGVRTIVQLEEPDLSSDQDLNLIKQAVEAEGLRFELVYRSEDYINHIAKEVQRDDNPCYVVAAPFIQNAVLIELKSCRI